MILLLCVAFAACVGGTYQDSSPQYTLYKIYILEEDPQKHYEKEPLISEKEVEECFTKHTNIIEKRLALEQKLAKEGEEGFTDFLLNKDLRRVFDLSLLRVYRFAVKQ
ncbi:hypothetical protein AVEN_241518-1 [Araneus ventricosus]|uniref:Uncharacterized protein n=1 Tax=Araneus ventricosus TaxID=182803 RepID=A0A4Y2KY95_ARAVE|nr:hypothetical protein AVEN_241518-1 [Araneus ventricosus]